MKAIKRMGLAALIVAGMTLPALATGLGDKAPALKIAEWVKGEPVNVQDNKDNKIYVVEFWATWCAPCRMSIPHLTELQKKFKDKGVVIVGISDEQPQLEKVKSFVKDQGEKMDYIVAVDDKEATNKAYMREFGVNGIPHAFIIDRESRIIWHGHPMDGMDQVLEQVVAGKYDVAKAKQREEAQKLYTDYFNTLVEKKSASDPDVKAKGDKLLKIAGDDASLMNGFAWTILTHPMIPDRDLPLATKAAKNAYDTTDGKDAAVADTYARALFDSGKHSEAIEIQKKAIALTDDAEMKKELEKTLAQYEKDARKQ